MQRSNLPNETSLSFGRREIARECNMQMYFVRFRNRNNRDIGVGRYVARQRAAPIIRSGGTCGISISFVFRFRNVSRIGASCRVGFANRRKLRAQAWRELETQRLGPSNFRCDLHRYAKTFESVSRVLIYKLHRRYPRLTDRHLAVSQRRREIIIRRAL